MTDKEIIIDDVNVAGCEFYCDEYCTLSNDRNERLPFAEKCSGYSDCLYKQLQRKKQECEKLREANDEKNEFLKKLGISATGEFHRIKHYIDKLHQECEELKRENKRLVGEIANSVFDEIEELDRYKQVLEKIEDYCNEQNLKMDYTACQILKIIGD